MALLGMLFHQQLLLGLMILAATAANQDSQPNSSCSIYCGSLCIPYPFETRWGHFLDDSFYINCDNTSGTPKPTLGYDKNLEVLNISLDGELRVSSPVTRRCNNSYNSFQSIRSKFPISDKRNNLIGVGLYSVSYIFGLSGKIFGTGCVPLSSGDYDGPGRDSKVFKGSCSGDGCCNISIPEGVTNFSVQVFSLLENDNSCLFAFVVEKEAHKFSTLDLDFSQNRTTVPVVLDWAVGNETCKYAKRNQTTYACKALNSTCHNSDNGPGYRCNCSSGFQGNPYVHDGCKDIDECQTSKPCIHTDACHNFVGGFKCSCPKGFKGNGIKGGSGCTRSGDSRGVIIALCISIISLLVLLLGGSWIFWGLKRRKYMKLKEKFFQQNGGLLLKQQLSNHQSSFEKTKIFTTEELKKATNNYDESRVIGQGGFGTVYKGVLSDNSVVAIKKSKIADQSQIEQFINEVIVLTQIRHRNVVQLFGCCLETEVPLLVYEFITNGTLYDHIHDKDRSSLLSWEKRLKITTDSAEALAYLHSATSMPIIHRDVKTTNILLDDNYIAKVSDFGASRLVPLDQTQLNTLVQGTLGYLDPEYMQTSQLTEKSDVYSFGVVMAELLTGKKALSFIRPENDRNLAIYFVTAIKEDRLVQILEEHIVNEGKIEQLKEVANLAKRCLRLRGEDRPSMKEVATELERLRSLEKHPSENIDVHAKKTESFLSATSHSFNIDVSTGCSTSSTAEYDSLKDQILKPMDDGR